MLSRGHGPETISSFYRVDVNIKSPSGSYFPTRFANTNVVDTENILSVVKEYIKPNRSIDDIAGQLSADLLARFPKASGITIGFLPDISRAFRDNQGLSFAIVDFNTISPSLKCYDPSADYARYGITTEWALPDPEHLGKTQHLRLKTLERQASPVHDHLPQSSAYSPISNLVDFLQRESRALGQTHPTLLIHQKVADHLRVYFDRNAQTTALKLAELAFRTTDEQSACQRLEEVRITIGLDPRLNRKKGTPLGNQIRWRTAIKLDRTMYEQSRQGGSETHPQIGRHRAFIGVGSNLGKRVELIESACRELTRRGIPVLRTSALYETKPMYLEDQQQFLNGVLEVSTCVVEVLLTTSNNVFPRSRRHSTH